MLQQKNTISKLADSKSVQEEKSLFFSLALTQFLENLPPRSRDIVMARFGMHGSKQKTLELSPYLKKILLMASTLQTMKS